MKVLLVVSLSLLISFGSFCRAQADQNFFDTLSDTLPPSSAALPNAFSHQIGSDLTADLLEVNYLATHPFSKPDSGKDTILLQDGVLKRINEALVRGAITPEEASTLKAQLNTLGTQESWYKSLGIYIPTAVFEEDEKKIAALTSYIDKKLPLKLNNVTSRPGVIHDDVDRWIGRALATNKISNSQAEQYYSQVAQIENDAESLKNDPAGSNSEIADLNQRLQLLKADIQSKAKL